MYHIQIHVYVYGTNESHTCIYEENICIIYKYTCVWDTNESHTFIYEVNVHITNALYNYMYKGNIHVHMNNLFTYLHVKIN